MLAVNEGRKRYVYGAGFAGKVTAGYLSFCMQKKVEAIVVSNGHKELDIYQFPESISREELPILEFDELDKSEACDFYVTLDKGKSEVIQMLQAAKMGG